MDVEGSRNRGIPWRLLKRIDFPSWFTLQPRLHFYPPAGPNLPFVRFRGLCISGFEDDRRLWSLGQAGFRVIEQGTRGNRNSKELLQRFPRGLSSIIQRPARIQLSSRGYRGHCGLVLRLRFLSKFHTVRITGWKKWKCLWGYVRWISAIFFTDWFYR